MRLRHLAPVLLCVAFLAGCGSKKSVRVAVPPVPPPTQSGESTTASKPPAEQPSLEEQYPPGTQPIYVETGIASWYGPPYHGRKAANGEIFDTNQLTAAHRTLPLNSIARVTNLKTGHSTLVRITDRGPFIPGRMLDLSVAAAKAVDVWRPGLATVKLEVLHSPTPIDTGGRWCVQIGAFTDKAEAASLKNKLTRRYHTAQVLQFTGPTGDWLRIRVLDDVKARAQEVARDTRTPQGSIFLVRLD